jgi:predicted RNase H-like nuclease (RuvC/YqgF family)
VTERREADDRTIERLRRALAERDREIAELRRQLAEQAKQMAELQRRLALREQNSTITSETAVVGWTGRSAA